MGFFKKLRKRISKLKRFAKQRPADATSQCANCVELKGEISELNRQLGQVIDHYCDSVAQQLNSVNAVGQFQFLVDDLNQQLLPRVCSLSKQLDELYDSMIVSPSDEMNNCFVSEEVPRGVSENKHSEVASEQHMLDDAMAAVDEIQREGEEKEEEPLSQSQEILKMEKSYAKCFHAPDSESFPAVSINESSCNSPTTQSGEVPCLICKNSLTQTQYYLTEINGDSLCGEEANCNIIEDDPLSCAEEACEDDDRTCKGENQHGSSKDEEDQHQLWCSSSDIRQFYENLYAHQETLESHEESLHPSTVLADENTCKPHENTASVADELSTYTVSLNELESAEDAVKMSTQYFCCGHSNEVDGTLRDTKDDYKVPPPPGFSNTSYNTEQVYVIRQETPEELLARIAAGRMRSNSPPDVIIEELPD